MIVLHIAIALASIILTTVAYFAVLAWALRGAYISAVLTLLSGTYLVWAAPSHMLHVCLAGVVYLVIVSIGIVLARGRLKHVNSLAAHR